MMRQAAVRAEGNAVKKATYGSTYRQGGHLAGMGKKNDGGGANRGAANKAAAPPAGGANDGKFAIGDFKMDKNYTDLQPIGKGSYGIVCSAFNKDTNLRVAVKKVSPISAHVIDAKHVLREIRMMRYLGQHQNIITLKDLFVREAEDELYIVMELLDSDLHRIIQSSQALSDTHHRYFMHQLLKGLKFLHDHRIIHRDLKPGNLLVTRSCELRITDFGLARARPVGKGEHPDDLIDEPMTEHVVTRWYRPPELMLSPDGLYTYAVDMWSVGCIFAELLGRKPLFPGKNFVHQLTLIFDVIGAPKSSEVAHVRSSQAKRFLESVSHKLKIPFSVLFPQASPDAVSLLETLLVFNPADRLTVDQALAHPYFEALRSTPSHAPPPVTEGLDFSFEQGGLSRYQLKQLILREVESFRRENRLASLGPAASHSSASQSGVGTSSSVHSAWTTSSACSSSATRFGDKARQTRDLIEEDDEEADENVPPAVPVPPLPKTSTDAAAAAAAAVTRQRNGRKVRPSEQPPHYRSSKLRPRESTSDSSSSCSPGLDAAHPYSCSRSTTVSTSDLENPPSDPDQQMMIPAAQDEPGYGGEHYQHHTGDEVPEFHHRFVGDCDPMDETRLAGASTMSLPPPQRVQPRAKDHAASSAGLQRSFGSASLSVGRGLSGSVHSSDNCHAADSGGGVRPPFPAGGSQGIRSVGSYVSASSTTSSSGSRGRDPLEERRSKSSSGGATRRGHGNRQQQYQYQCQCQHSSDDMNESIGGSGQMMVSECGSRGATTEQLDSKMSGMQLAEEVRPPKTSTASSLGRGLKGTGLGRSLKYPGADAAGTSGGGHDPAGAATNNPLAAVLSSNLRFRGGSTSVGAAQFSTLGPADATNGPRPPAASASAAAASGSLFNPEGSQGRQAQSLLSGTSSGRRQLTVPKSPHFSIMSWQRKGASQQASRRTSTGSQPRAWK